ncbi:MAG: transcription termination/antitermination protein NusG [Simkaniaceae bacterium]|nr:transcription termination/antitermination protein NusG [Simkaniaceae bacterium]
MAGNWYVVQVLSGQEKKAMKAVLENRAAAGMLELVEDVVVPTENVAEVKKGEQKISEKRLWPGYMLVKMILTDDSWMYVKDSNGVIDFLGGGKPQPLSEKEVEQLLSDLEGKKGTVVQKHDFEPGDKIKIVDGVFVNFVGVVTEVFHDKGRLSANVMIFGRETRVDDLEFWQVEKLSAEADLN